MLNLALQLKRPQALVAQASPPAVPQASAPAQANLPSAPKLPAQAGSLRYGRRRRLRYDAVAIERKRSR